MNITRIVVVLHELSMRRSVCRIHGSMLPKPVVTFICSQLFTQECWALRQGRNEAANYKRSPKNTGSPVAPKTVAPNAGNDFRFEKRSLDAIGTCAYWLVCLQHPAPRMESWHATSRHQRCSHKSQYAERCIGHCHRISTRLCSAWECDDGCGDACFDRSGLLGMDQ